MRNDLEYYRKFSIPDYCLNAKKFREYCEFCKKTENLSEKKRILENLVNYANTVSISNTSKKKEIIDNIVNLCSNAILNSDLEIEILFEIENFSINFQKQILIGVITLSYDKTKEISNYNQIKYHLWIIKSQNLLLKEGKTLEIPSDEVGISIQTLEKEMNDIKSRFNDSQTQVNMKILILKVAYELGYYYFLYKNYSKSIDCYGFLLDNYFPSNLLYFNIEKVNSVMNRLKNYGNISKTVNSSNSDMKIDNIKCSDSIPDSFSNNKVNFLDIVNLHKLLETSQISFDEYSTNIITYYKINELGYLELVNTNEILSLCRKSIYNTLLYPSKLVLFKEILKKINQINSQRQVKVSEKEISYYTLIQLCFELENNINEDKMKEVLKEVSSTIMKYDIPSDKDSLVILNLILINYTEYIYLTCKFLSDLTQYLNKKSLEESVEIIYIRDLSSCLQLYKSNMEINLTYNQNNNLCGMLFGLSYILKTRNYDFFNLILICIKNIEINLLLHRILLIYVTQVINIINQKEERKENEEDDLILELCEENNQVVSLYNELYETVLSEVGICNRPKVVYDDKSYSNNHFIDDKNNIDELYKSLYILYTFILNIESNIHKSITAFQMKSTGSDSEENILLIKRKIILNSIIQKISQLTKNNVCKDENKRRGQIIQSSIAIYFNYKLSLRFNSLYTSLGTNQIDENEYSKFKELVLFDSCMKYYIDSLIEEKRVLEYLFLSQYKIYKYHSLSNRYQPKNILQLLESSKVENHNEVILELFFSVPFLEALSCYYMERGYKDKVERVTFQMKRVSIHQFNVKTDYRRGFKVYNFLKFLEIQRKSI